MIKDVFDWVALYGALWLLALLWSFVTSRWVDKGTLYQKIWEGGMALLSFAAGGAAVSAVAVGMEANIGVGYIFLFSAGVATTIFPALLLGEYIHKKSGGRQRSGHADVERWLTIPRPAWLAGQKAQQLLHKIAKTKDMKTLFQAVMYPSFAEVRQAALEKITDERALYDIARFFSEKARTESLDEQERLLCCHAVQKMTDESLLHDCIMLTPNNDSLQAMWQAGIAKITNEQLLADIAVKRHKVEEIFTPAVEHITDSLILQEIFSLPHLSTVSKRILLGRISDAAFLLGIAQEAPITGDTSLQQVALSRLTQQNDILTVVNTAHAPAIRAEAVERLTGRADLLHLAKTAPDATVRHKAAGSKYLAEADYIDLATTSPDPGVRAAAALCIENPSALQAICTKEKSIEVLRSICGRGGIPHTLNGCQCTRCGNMEHDFVFVQKMNERISRVAAVQFDLYQCTRCGATERRNGVGGGID